MSNVVNLLVNIIDTNKTNQEFLMNNYKSYDLVQSIVTQTKSLKLAGLGALLVSHLVWNNLDAQSTFATRELIKRLI